MIYYHIDINLSDRSIIEYNSSLVLTSSIFYKGQKYKRSMDCDSFEPFFTGRYIKNTISCCLFISKCCYDFFIFFLHSKFLAYNSNLKALV